MRLSRLVVPATLAVFIGSVSGFAQETHQHKHELSEKLGRVSFATSCTKPAQQKFNRAVALLHSFWYDEAEKGFADVAKTDPKCGMGYWGIAMSWYHPVWQPPTTIELQNGIAAAEKASLVSARTQREKDYIAAIATFYKDSDKLDHRTRALAYEKAMEQLHLRYPNDREAGIFYSLALLGTALPTDKTYANQKKAAGILNKVLAAEPNHPGVAHYIIHSFDYPALADLALAAARSYSKIAPDSPHALHMPSHIFIRLGLWPESIESNIASAAAGKKHASAKDEIHALDYLAYAYLQTSQDGKAKELNDAVYAMQKVDAQIFQVAYALAAIPARYTLERRQWAEAAALKVPVESFPWNKFAYAEANVYFARSLGASRSGDTAAASADIERLTAMQKSLAEAKEVYWATQVEIQRLGASAWLAHAEGKRDEALKLMRAAADLEDTTEKHPVTPGAVLPARELLGELLLELREPQQALKEFEASLRLLPNRFNGLYGAAKAAESAGDRNKAKNFYAKLTALGERGDGNRPELQAAKVFLTGN
jgi:tetratricopeptide (TPR) repeat protein